MVTVTDLTKSYKGRKAVDRLSFQIGEGQIFALLGSNGAGKSTTIKMILGLVQKDEGDISLESGVRVGYSPETPYFPPFLTGMEVLSYYARLQRPCWQAAKRRAVSRERAGEGAAGRGTGKQEKSAGELTRQETEECERLLEKAGLSKELPGGSRRKGTMIKHYSKGMLQRLALAQALLGDPELLILDEPCAGLDALGRIEMLRLLEELRREGKTILMNSHILSDMEKICDRGIILKDGEMLRSFDKSEFGGGVSLEQIFLDTMGGK